MNTHNLMTMFMQTSIENAKTVGIKIIFITIQFYDNILSL